MAFNLDAHNTINCIKGSWQVVAQGYECSHIAHDAKLVKTCKNTFQINKNNKNPYKQP